MGSYLSIVNDTQDPWQCKIGPDEAALKIAGVAISAIGAVAAAIGTAGAAAPIAASLTANGAVGVFGVSASTLATVTAGTAAAAAYASVVGDVSGFGLTVAKGVSDKLKNDGYEMVAPGQSHRWGKMSLSLWQQGTCVKSVLVDEKTVRVETLFMRPIFSGATKGSNRNHYIQSWINKKGTKKQEIVAHEGQRLLLEEATNEDDGEMLPPVDKLFYFYANGTNTYDN